VVDPAARSTHDPLAVKGPRTSCDLLTMVEQSAQPVTSSDGIRPAFRAVRDIRGTLSQPGAG
jgi:hypothetical protein